MRPTILLRGFLSAVIISGIGVPMSSCAQESDSRLATAQAIDVSTAPSRIAITIDDLPFVPRSSTSAKEGLRYVESINAALRKHGIVATGFAVGQQIDAQTIPAVQAFADAGHTIGNHSWSHPDYGTLTGEEFRAETARTDAALRKWIDGPRYYRFPFLRQGKTEQQETIAKDILTALGYQNVPVTIDNDEWQFNADYLAAIQKDDSEAANNIAVAYIAHMQERTAHFQTLARNDLGGDVDHILLIHLNRINADHLVTLLDWYAAQNWTFIEVEEALMHPLFSKPDLYTGPRGLSQIERVLGRKSE